MGVKHKINMKVFIALAAVLAVSYGRPRYLVIPLEDVDFGNSAAVQSFPVYRMPELARQARAAQQEEDSYQIAPVQSPYDAPDAGPDHVDYGAYTGGYGAFGWYTDHPVLL